MRIAKLWPAASILLLGGWIMLTGASAAEPSAGRDQSEGQSTREKKPQSDSDDHVRHHAALGVLTGNSENGVSVVGLIPGSPAERAGLRVGDEIRFVGDQRIRTTQGLTEEIRDSKPDASIDLTIRRNGQRRVVSVTLGSQDSTFGNRHQVNRMMPTGNEGSPAYNSGRNSGSTNGNAQRIRALQQQIARLQQELNQVMSYQAAQQPDPVDDWNWERSSRSGHDPDIDQ